MNTLLTLPRFIALCGNPTSGKSTVQKLMRLHFDVQPVDDGHCLRDFAIRHMGATAEDVETQEGKLRPAYMLGEPVIDQTTGEHITWRQVLGRIGNHLETLFGEEFMPYSAMQRVERHVNGHYSFGSVRKTQGWAYRNRGGVVIGVRAPWAGPSGNDFDVFDERCVNYWINNDEKDEGVLLQKISRIMAMIDYCQTRHLPHSVDSFLSHQ